MGPSGTSVCGHEVDVPEHPSRKASIRETYRLLLERSRRNWANAGWIHHWSRRPFDGSWRGGAMVAIGMEVAQAQTRLYFNIGR